MKFLEYTPLNRLNLFFSNLKFGESTLKGSLEAYSCKHTTHDRKVSCSLEQKILDNLGQSSDGNSTSPVDYLSSRSSRRTLIYLVLTLNHMYPDYDFSAVQAHLFFREELWDNFKQILDTYMFEAAKEWTEANEGSSLLEKMSEAIDEVVKLGECEIYSYNPDFEGDPLLEKRAIGMLPPLCLREGGWLFEPSSLKLVYQRRKKKTNWFQFFMHCRWSFNFFFYNRKLKRVVSFRCCCLSNVAADGFLSDEITTNNNEDGDEDIFGGMDI